jgi:hypothetical protein
MLFRRMRTGKPEHRGSEICGLGFNHWLANYRHPTGARFASARQPTQ